VLLVGVLFVGLLECWLMTFRLHSCWLWCVLPTNPYRNKNGQAASQTNMAYEIPEIPRRPRRNRLAKLWSICAELLLPD
jgi:hypothetical protein